MSFLLPDKPQIFSEATGVIFGASLLVLPEKSSKVEAAQLYVLC